MRSICSMSECEFRLNYKRKRQVDPTSHSSSSSRKWLFIAGSVVPWCEDVLGLEAAPDALRDVLFRSCQAARQAASRVKIDRLQVAVLWMDVYVPANQPFLMFCI